MMRERESPWKTHLWNDDVEAQKGKEDNIEQDWLGTDPNQSIGKGYAFQLSLASERGNTEKENMEGEKNST